MNTRFLLIFACSIMLFSAGCMQFTVAGGGDKDEDSKNGKVFYGSFYGFWWEESPQECIMDKMQEKDGTVDARPLYQVMYTSNYLYSAASVLSLGFFVPVDIRWTLIQKPPEEYSGPVVHKKAKRDDL